MHHNDAARTQVLLDAGLAGPRRADEGISGQALRAGEPVMAARLDPSIFQSEGRAEAAARVGFRSALAAPLIAGGTALGTLVAYRDVTGEPYDETDLQLCADLAERSAQAIYNARLMADVKRADAERAAAQDRLRHAQGIPRL